MKINNLNNVKTNNYINDFSSVRLTPYNSGKKLRLENKNKFVYFWDNQ